MMTDPILIIGLGSMGKRRVRNLLALGYTNIIGFDARADRRKEAEEKHNITAYSTFEEACTKHPKAFVISVPPDAHHIYMKKAIEMNTPCFVEASVVDTDMANIIQKARAKHVFIAPSSTMYFHPAIKKIMEIVNSGELGKISNFIYHMGNFLPDWHTYEKVSDFYVSKKETGGAREIVPFDLTWITKLLGFPTQVCGMYKKTVDIEGAPEIDDTYNAILDYNHFMVMLTIDVVSKSSIRRLLLNGSEKELIWNWDDNHIKIFDHKNQKWDIIEYEVLAAEAGYNKNITEQMYIDEMDCFMKGIKNPAVYVNTLEEDHKVLKLLYAIEESYTTKSFVKTNL